MPKVTEVSKHYQTNPQPQSQIGFLFSLRIYELWPLDMPIRNIKCSTFVPTAHLSYYILYYIIFSRQSKTKNTCRKDGYNYIILYYIKSPQYQEWVNPSKRGGMEGVC